MGAWLCAECISRSPRVEPPICPRCGESTVADAVCPRCRNSPLQIENIRSVVYFEGVLREAIHELKYSGRTVLAEPLGDLMATYWLHHSMPVDVVVPVPLHPTRLHERGYNQAGLLARHVGRRVGLVVNDCVLMRHRATLPQVELDSSQRKENVHAAFSCSSDALAGTRVLLVDDVCTTGATLESCAAALREGGVRSVYALTLARPRQ
jgi:ComF family protein